MHLGKYGAAQKIYQDLSKRDPKNDRYHFQLGMCYLADELLDNAKQEFEACLQINPRHTEALIELGDIHFKAGEDETALNYLARGVDADPNHARAQTYLARLHEHLGNYPAAIEHYTRAVEGTAASESPRHDLALAHTHNGDYLEAYLILQELLDEADLGLLWSRINRTEADLAELNISATEDYIGMLKSEMEEIERFFYRKAGYSIRYTKGILDALEQFLSLSESEITAVRNEIQAGYSIRYTKGILDALEQHMGVGFAGDVPRFQLHSLSGRLSGFDLGCYLHTAEQLTRSDLSLGGKYQTAFIEALNFFKSHN
jgi:tetratricopeptide (TPR) repeat protein